MPDPLQKDAVRIIETRIEFAADPSKQATYGDVKAFVDSDIAEVDIQKISAKYLNDPDVDVVGISVTVK